MTKRRAIVLVLLALAALAVGGWALTRSEQVTVPAVIDRGQARATAILERAGFEVGALTVENCATPGTVIEQQPAAGTEADTGSTVTLTVSLGLEVRIPSVRGMRLARARDQIEDENLLVETRERASPTVAAGHVIRSEPTVGELADCGSVVTLFVSTGPELVTLPSLLGLQRDSARAQLRRLDLIPDVNTRHADQPEGEVIGQDPGPDSRLEPGATVTIIVSTGRGAVIVPNVERLTLDAARQNLADRNLSVSVVREETDVRRDDDRVLEQAPGSGQRVRTGDVVTIVVGRYVAPEPPPEPPSDEAGEP